MTINKDICVAEKRENTEKYVDEEEVENIFSKWYMVHMPFAKSYGEKWKRMKKRTHKSQYFTLLFAYAEKISHFSADVGI